MRAMQARGQRLPRDQTEGLLMSTRNHLTDSKVHVHKDDGRWQVTFPCDCPDLNFRRHDVALTFATHHACPPPWAPIPVWRKRLTRTVR